MDGEGFACAAVPAFGFGPVLSPVPGVRLPAVLEGALMGPVAVGAPDQDGALVAPRDLLVAGGHPGSPNLMWHAGQLEYPPNVRTRIRATSVCCRIVAVLALSGKPAGL